MACFFSRFATLTRDFQFGIGNYMFGVRASMWRGRQHLPTETLH